MLIIEGSALAQTTGATAPAASSTDDPATPPAAPRSATATAQDTTQDIIVTGTRRTDRTVLTSASPIDVISSTELQAQPTANVIDSLKNIVPSFFVGQNTISDASSFVRAPSLRGLPSDEVLVMLNGKRYNRSALVQVYSGGDTGLSFGSQGSDLSAIPSIAIKDLQVLRDGAASQYGSDAIAGVLNFGLREDTGFEVEGRFGETYRGDGRSRQIAADAGVALGDRGFINLAGEYNRDGGTSRGATRPLALEFADENPGLASQLPNYPGPVQIWGSSPTHGYKLLLNSGYHVTDDSEIYFFGNLAHSYANESFNYRSPISGSAVDEAGNTVSLGANGAFNNTFYLTPCPAGTATCPNGGFVKDGNTFAFTSFYPAGFTPRFVGKTDERFATLGYKGDLGKLHYDLSGSLSRNSLDLSMYDSLSPSYGPESQTSFKFGNLIQKEQDANLDLSYPLDLGLASPLTLSGGAEYRREQYTQTTGDAQSYGAGPYAVAQQLYTEISPGVYAPAGTSRAESPGASGYGGTSPAAAGSFSQRSFALYGDAETDITSRLSVGAAVRYEHYNTFGADTVWKVNAIYRLSDALSVRGTVGTGFHAPSPGQSNDEILTTNFVGGNQVQTGTYPVGSEIAQYFGAKTLKPEKSTNFGAGIVARPMSNLTLTVDAYDIKVKDRIGISENFTVTDADVAAQPALAAVGVGGVINYFTNGFNTVTRGVDVVATYHTGFVGGAMNITLAYNYNLSKVSSYDPAVIDQNQILDVRHLAPNHRANLGATWSKGPWTLNARENYYSWWLDAVDYGNQHFGSKFTTDLDVSYTFNRTATLTVGATNLFNTYPEKLKQSSEISIFPVTGSTLDGQIYPRSGGPFGINGGLWYVRLRVKY